jgi:hypothetical protein
MEDFSVSANRTFNQRETKLSVSLLGGDFLSILVEDRSTGSIWRFDSSAARTALQTTFEKSFAGILMPLYCSQRSNC